MVNDVLYSFLEYDDAVKDEKWAKEKVMIIQRDALAIMDKTEYDTYHNILMGRFPEADLKAIFAHSTMVPYYEKLSKSSVYLFESVRHAIIDDRIQSDLRVYVNSLDPDKPDKMQEDKELYQNKLGIESLMNGITQNNGMPPVKIKGGLGGDFNGNVDEYEKDGGDPLDDEEFEEWLRNAWGLLHEIELQKPINAVFRANQFVRKYPEYINDILIKLHVASQVYVDDMTGGMPIEQLRPWELYVLNPTGSDDYKDAQGFRITRATNVRGFLKHFGSDFDIQSNWAHLLSATGITITNGIATSSEYSGIADQHGQLMYGRTGGKLANFKNVLDLPISYEYCEWKAITKIRKQLMVTSMGNIIPVTINEHNPPIDGAAMEEKTYEETYRAYYLSTGSQISNPQLIKWGKVYMHQAEGFNDEYSGFTIKVNKRDGTPMAEIIRPFYNLMNVSFKMFEMLINDIKPDGWFFNYTSLVKIAKFIQESKDAPDDMRSAIDDYLKMIQGGTSGITDNPETAEGDPMGGGNMAVMPKKNGINAAAVELMKIMDWIELKIQKYTSTDGVVPTGNDGFKLSLENKKRTRQATSYIDFILLTHMEDIAVTILNYTQDISKFKDLPAYDYLVNLVGTKCMDFISTLTKAPHRYGTFIDTFNNDIELLEMKQLAMSEYQKGTLPFEEVLKVRSCDSVKSALLLLAKARRKAAKQAQENQMGLLKEQDANAERAFQRQLKIDDNKGQWLERAKGKEAGGFANAAAVNANSKIAAENIKQSGQNQRLADKATNEVEKIREEANAESQKSSPI